MKLHYYKFKLLIPGASMIQIRPSTSFDPQLMFSDVKDNVSLCEFSCEPGEDRVTKSMDHPVWECGDGADVGEVCTG
jgi:hypothetical protein